MGVAFVKAWLLLMISGLSVDGGRSNLTMIAGQAWQKVGHIPRFILIFIW